MYGKARVKLNLKKLYAADGRAVQEMLKARRTWLVRTYPFSTHSSFENLSSNGFGREPVADWGKSSRRLQVASLLYQATRQAERSSDGDLGEGERAGPRASILEPGGEGIRSHSGLVRGAAVLRRGSQPRHRHPGPAQPDSTAGGATAVEMGLSAAKLQQLREARSLSSEITQLGARLYDALGIQDELKAAWHAATELSSEAVGNQLNEVRVGGSPLAARHPCPPCGSSV